MMIDQPGKLLIIMLLQDLMEQNVFGKLNVFDRLSLRRRLDGAG